MTKLRLNRVVLGTLLGISLIVLGEQTSKAHWGQITQRKLASTSGMQSYVEQTFRMRLKGAYKKQAPALAKHLVQVSQKYGIDPVLVLAVIQTESNFNPLARGRHGEIGLMQLKPDTAEWISSIMDMKWNGSHSLESPKTNIELGVVYLSWLKEQFPGKGNIYLAAYNSGLGTVSQRLAQNTNVPQIYLGKIMSSYWVHYRSLIDRRV